MKNTLAYYTWAIFTTLKHFMQAPGVYAINLFTVVINFVLYKLECLSLSVSSTLVNICRQEYLPARVEPYTGPHPNIWLGVEMFQSDKHPSLL